MTVSETRRTLRAEGRRARTELAGQARVAAERKLLLHLGSLHLVAGATIGVYCADDGEPDLGRWIEHLRAGCHDIALPVPAAGTDDFTMQFRRWEAGEALVAGRYGIPCPPPQSDRLVIPELVFVPLVRFDAAGNRLGRGAGYYDRWLSEARPATIGVAFECQRADELEPQPHDVRLDCVVTDLGVRWSRARCGEGTVRS